ALTVERIGRTTQQAVERAVLVRPLGSERRGQLVEGLVDLVELDRYARVGGVEYRVILHLRAGLVGRRQLDIAVADDGRRDDDRLRVGGHLVISVPGQLDSDLVTPWLDRLDLA